MDSYNIMFFVLAGIIVASSVLTVVTRSIMRAATFLFFALLGTAGMYFLMGYTFLGAVQTMVYAGGIIVLYVFAILLTRGVKDRISENTRKKIALSAVLSLVGLGLVGYIIFTAKLRSAVLTAPDERVMSMTRVGENMLSTDMNGYLLPFEAVSILLLACIVAGVMIARKR